MSGDIWFERTLRQYVETELTEAKGRIDQLEAELACALNVARWFEKAEARRLELESAIDKLAECKGRYHTEANFKALMAVRNK